MLRHCNVEDLASNFNKILLVCGDDVLRTLIINYQNMLVRSLTKKIPHTHDRAWVNYPEYEIPPLHHIEIIHDYCFTTFILTLLCIQIFFFLPFFQRGCLNLKADLFWTFAKLFFYPWKIDRWQMRRGDWITCMNLWNHFQICLKRTFNCLIQLQFKTKCKEKA